MHLTDKLKDLPTSTLVLLRTPKNGPPGTFEQAVRIISQAMGFTVKWYSPQAGGRDQTYLRDYDLVRGADEVWAFFDAETVMMGGTAHVVDAAQNTQTPVSAWSIDHAGHIFRVGEN